MLVATAAASTVVETTVGGTGSNLARCSDSPPMLAILATLARLRLSEGIRADRLRRGRAVAPPILAARRRTMNVVL